MRNLIKLTTNLFILMFVSFSSTANNQFSVSMGYERTTGDYGRESDTDIISIPFAAQYIENAWRFRVSVPFISVTGDGSVIPGSNGIISNTEGVSSSMGFGPGSSSMATSSDTQSGMGDINTSVSYAFLPTNSDMFYEVTAEAKWGMASVNKNLGTGENDFSLSVYNMYEKYDIKPFFISGLPIYWRCRFNKFQ